MDPVSGPFILQTSPLRPRVNPVAPADDSHRLAHRSGGAA